MKNQQQLTGLRPSISISPGQALWNQRQAIVALRERFETLRAAIGSPSDFNLYQWAEIAAFALEFHPDLIVELGRGFGNSTSCFIEVANRLGGAGACRVLSLCLSDGWFTQTVPRLTGLVPPEWFAPAQVEVADILTYNLAPALAQSRRCLILWDAHGFDIAEWVLSRLLPQLVDKCHVVLMHDLSDARFEIPSREYQEAGIWKGTNARTPAFWLGHIFSKVAQAISIVDFTSRNRLLLHSAAESLHVDIASDSTRITELTELLGDELFSLNAHWFWFSLNEAFGSLSFPHYTKAGDFTIEGAQTHILGLQKQVEKLHKEKRELQILFEETGQKLEREIAQVLVEKRSLENTWNAVQSSTSWRLLNKWRRVRNRMAPDRTWRRTLYDLVLRPSRGHSSEH